jgi:hypothetical protein
MDGLDIDHRRLDPQRRGVTGGAIEPCNAAKSGAFPASSRRLP